MIALLKRWIAERQRRRAAIRAAREYATRTTGRATAPWPFGHCRAVTTDRCYICILYHDGVGCGRGLFAVHNSGVIEAVTAGEVRSVRKYRCWC
jgi:hypothetical protein